MTKRVFFAAFAASIFALPASGMAQEGATAEQTAANAAAKTRGEQIYWHDQAALNASAVLFDAISMAEHPNLRGYVTQELGEGQIGVTYYAVAGEAYSAFASFVVEGSTVASGSVVEAEADKVLPEPLLRLAKARDAALVQGAKEELQLCMTSGPNFVTLPDAAGDTVSVYILSSPGTSGRYPIGGHYMFQVDAENTVTGGRAFADGCLDVPVINQFVTNAPDNFSMVHMMDAQPNEMHHFVARQMNLPLLLVAGEVNWTLDYRAE